MGKSIKLPSANLDGFFFQTRKKYVIKKHPTKAATLAFVREFKLPPITIAKGKHPEMEHKITERANLKYKSKQTGCVDSAHSITLKVGNPDEFFFTDA